MQEIWMQGMRMPCNDRGKDLSDEAVNQGMHRIARNYQKLGKRKEGFPSFRTFRESMALPVS